MTRSIALGFVIYKSGRGFLSRAQHAIDLGFNVYIFDNSPRQDDARVFFAGKDRAHYFTCGKNLGLGLGISSVCAQAYYQNHAALLFFDQDSIFEEETLNFIESYYLSHPELEATHSAVEFNASGDGSPSDCFKNVTLAINSGSLFYLRNLMALNWHNETYFVDGVDYEFCLRSKVNGLKIGRYSCTPGFDHSTQQDDKIYKILGRTYAMRAYSISRVLDATMSSWRLMAGAVVRGEFRFALKMARLWVIYMLVQALVRVLDLFAGKEGKE